MTRRVIAAFFASLDGVIQAPGGPAEDPTGGFRFGGWGATHWDDAMGEYMGEGFGKPFDLLLGRKTWEIFAAHWPFTNEEPAALFNGITKYVATRGDDPLAWQNSVKLDGDAVEAVARLKEDDGPDLLTQGSAKLVRSLLAAGLVDELSLMTFPVLLGHGKRWYGEDAQAATRQRMDSFSPASQLCGPEVTQLEDRLRRALDPQRGVGGNGGGASSRQPRLDLGGRQRAGLGGASIGGQGARDAQDGEQEGDARERYWVHGEVVMQRAHQGEGLASRGQLAGFARGHRVGATDF
jgi:dihydrofolate reductase